MPDPFYNGLRVLAPGLVVAALLIGFSIMVVDRPVATFVHGAAGGHWMFVAMTHVVDPVLPGSAIGIIVAAIAVVSGWKPGRTGRTVIACCMAALMAYAIKDQLKYAFGRLWPETWVNNNPSWIRDGAYGFYPFHGGAGWGSFPSGHMAGIAAPMTVVWMRLTRWRWLAAVLVTVVAIGLVGADYHFVADVLAGTGVGVANGLGMLATLAAAWSDSPSNPSEPVHEIGDASGPA